MSVNWQSNEYYKGLKTYEKKSGTTLAERNVAANPYGKHSLFGVLLLQAVPPLLVSGAENLFSGNGLNGTTPKDDGTDVSACKTEISKFTKIKQRYDKARSKNDKTGAEKYLKMLHEIGSTSENPTVKNLYAKLI